MTEVLRLQANADNVGVRHRMFGPALAAKWSRQADPPLGAAQAGYYAAALETNLDPDSRARISRCLLLCHAEAGVVDPARGDWYRDVALAHLDDEHCAFVLAALCRQGVVCDDRAAEEAYRSVLRAEWADSRCWGAYELSRVALAGDLALLCARSDAITDDRLTRVEAAYRRPGARPEDRAILTGYLARAYREAGRTDNDALTVFNLRFTTVPDDAENLAYLAALWAARGQRDANACAAYMRMAEAESEPGEWTLRSARACVSSGKINEETQPLLRAAESIAPDDAEIVAGLAWCAARQEFPDAAGRRELEAALARESEILPFFIKNRWEWAEVVRNVARCWSVEGRLDDAARAVYARALSLCPHDDELVIAQAQMLSAANEHTPATIPVYTRALAAMRKADAAMPGAQMALLEALGRGYLQAGDTDAARPIWEELYSEGCDWPELKLALARAWAAMEKPPEAAITLWQRIIEAWPEELNVRLRLARALKDCGDRTEALRHYRQTARLDPDCIEAYRETGALLLQMSDPFSAEIWLRGALLLGDTDIETRFRLGEAILAQDRRDEAQAVFQEINERIDPGHTGTILRLVQLNRKMPSRPDGDFPQPGDTDEEDPAVYWALATRFRKDGNAAKEEQALVRLMELTPTDATAGAYLAELRLRRGDRAGAERILRQITAGGRATRKCYTLLGELMSNSDLKAA